MKVERNIVERIGIPAVLETCAEECNELAKACLKLSRKLRNEQPTPQDLGRVDCISVGGDWRCDFVYGCDHGRNRTNH